MGAYEALWQKFQTYNRLASHLQKHFEEQQRTINQIFEAHTQFLARISEALEATRENETKILECAKQALEILERCQIKNFGIRIQGETSYPNRLLDAKNPAYCLYFQGVWDFVESPCISVVGTRQPSEEGVKRTKRLVKSLVRDDYTIVSGLAKGIDTVAHETALAEGGRSIAVLGTPLQKQYPSSNRELRKKLEEDHLVISQFPISSKTQRYFFPERNKVMSALSEGTVIVEASNTSGTRVQAQAALEQNRKLFILNNCFEDPKLTWPQKFHKQGAVRVKDYSDIINSLVHNGSANSR